jgi:hypothetical protein
VREKAALSGRHRLRFDKTTLTLLSGKGLIVPPQHALQAKAKPLRLVGIAANIR